MVNHVVASVFTSECDLIYFLKYSYHVVEPRPDALQSIDQNTQLPRKGDLYVGIPIIIKLLPLIIIVLACILGRLVPPTCFLSYLLYVCHFLFCNTSIIPPPPLVPSIICHRRRRSRIQQHCSQH